MRSSTPTKCSYDEDIDQIMKGDRNIFWKNKNQGLRVVVQTAIDTSVDVCMYVRDMREGCMYERGEGGLID